MGFLDHMDLGGESSRIDYLVEQQEKLERRLAAFTQLLVAKGVLTREEIERFKVGTPAE